MEQARLCRRSQCTHRPDGCSAAGGGHTRPEPRGAGLLLVALQLREPAARPLEWLPLPEGTRASGLGTRKARHFRHQQLHPRSSAPNIAVFQLQLAGAQRWRLACAVFVCAPGWCRQWPARRVTGLWAPTRVALFQPACGASRMKDLYPRSAGPAYGQQRRLRAVVLDATLTCIGHGGAWLTAQTPQQFTAQAVQ